MFLPEIANRMNASDNNSSLSQLEQLAFRLEFLYWEGVLLEFLNEIVAASVIAQQLELVEKIEQAIEELYKIDASYHKTIKAFSHSHSFIKYRLNNQRRVLLNQVAKDVLAVTTNHH